MEGRVPLSVVAQALFGRSCMDVMQRLVAEGRVPLPMTAPTLNIVDRMWVISCASY